MSDKIAVDRKKFVHNGQTIYEWDQSLEEVNMYITPPSGTKAKMIDCKITSTHLTLGIRGNPPYLNHDLWAQVKTKESLWTMEDGVVHISLQKMLKGETWLAALKGHDQLDPMQQEELRKKMMLERFQEEVQQTGNAPDPRTFMGGIG